jgi:hypothetical protein
MPGPVSNTMDAGLNIPARQTCRVHLQRQAPDRFIYINAQPEMAGRYADEVCNGMGIF